MMTSRPSLAGRVSNVNSTSQSLNASEALSARGATHPRVSLADLNDAIKTEHYFTAGEACYALAQKPPVAVYDPLDILTICILVMKNGFAIIGKSAPASPENFDAEKGKTFAREDAIRQLWPLMGFELRHRLWASAEYGEKA